MNIDYLQEFVTLAETMNYSEASDRLYMNQSTLSKHIKALEKELDVSLLDRNTRNVELTSYGRQLLPYAEQISKLNYKYLRELSQKKNNVLTIGAIPTITQYGLLDIILEFKKKHPDIEIRIDEQDSTILQKGLLEGKYELAFMRSFKASFNLDDDFAQKFEAVSYFDDHLVAFIPKCNNLYKRKKLTIPELSGQRLCLLPKDTMQYNICIRAFQVANIIPDIFYESHRINNLLDMCMKANCIALLLSPPTITEKTLSNDFADNFNMIPITPMISSTLSLCRLKKGEVPESARMFIDYFLGKKAEFANKLSD